MRFIRSLLLMVFFVVYTVPYACVCFITFPFLGAEKRYWMAAFWCKSCIVVMQHLNGIRYRIEGMENLPDGPAILCPKHQSTWETFAFPTLMPRPLCYVFKRELLFIPFFGWAMARLDMVHIDRSKRTEAWSRVAEQGKRFMAQGNWVIMFPEGTRIARGQQGTYKTGATRLATATGASVVPIAVSSARCWPRKSFLIRPGLVTVSIGQPIAPAGREADELMREVEAWIEGEMRRIDPEAYPTT